MTRGTLILVCGPSGAGKDTLIAGARERLKDDPRFIFPRRVITRAANAGGEDHIAIDVPSFEKMRGGGAFALSWDAHGFSYGVPASIEDDLAQGRHVVINVSRTVIAEANRCFECVACIEVTADPKLVATRIAARGREGRAEVEARLRRAGLDPDLRGSSIIRLNNDGSLEEGIKAFLHIVQSITTPASERD